MRAIFAVADERSAQAILARFGALQIPVTQLASSGGFLRRGNVTLISTVEDAQVEAVLAEMRAAAEAQPDPRDRVHAFVMAVEDLQKI